MSWNPFQLNPPRAPPPGSPLIVFRFMPFRAFPASRTFLNCTKAKPRAWPSGREVREGRGSRGALCPPPRCANLSLPPHGRNELEAHARPQHQEPWQEQELPNRATFHLGYRQDRKHGQSWWSPPKPNPGDPASHTAHPTPAMDLSESTPSARLEQHSVTSPALLAEKEEMRAEARRRGP